MQSFIMCLWVKTSLLKPEPKPHAEYNNSTASFPNPLWLGSIIFNCFADKIASQSSCTIGKLACDPTWHELEQLPSDLDKLLLLLLWLLLLLVSILGSSSSLSATRILSNLVLVMHVVVSYWLESGLLFSYLGDRQWGMRLHGKASSGAVLYFPPHVAPLRVIV
jgi:hypothetical protein